MGFWEDRANLTGKVAVVVGGGGGLGRACALDLGRAGCRLALCDRNEQWLSETEATLVTSAIMLDEEGVVLCEIRTLNVGA